MKFEKVNYENSILKPEDRVNASTIQRTVKSGSSQVEISEKQAKKSSMIKPEDKSAMYTQIDKSAMTKQIDKYKHDDATLGR